MALTTNKKNKIIAEWKAGVHKSYNSIAVQYKIDPKTVKKIILSMDDIKNYEYKKAVSKRGYLYLVNAVDTSYYKIGIAKDIKSRLIAIQTGNHMEIKCVEWVIISDVRKKEKELHIKYKDFNHRNEWFLFNEELLCEVIDIFSNLRESTALEQS
jgi:hypothetical protein